MKLRKAIRLAAEFGPVVVLLLLFALFTALTSRLYYPQSPAAGVKLADRLVEQYGPEVKVLVLAVPGADSQPFVEAIEQELQRQGVTGAASFVGNPGEIRGFLDGLPTEGDRVTAIATNHRTASLSFLQDAILRERGGAFTDTSVEEPESYYWPTFLQVENLTNLLNNSAQVAIIAVGMTLVIITAGIDLSVGSVMALAAVTTAVSINSWFGGAEASTWGLIGGGLVGIGVGALCGAFNGLVTTFLRVPPFIVTLAMFMIARGLALVIATSYGHIGADGTTAATPEAVTIEAEAFGYLGMGRPFGIPLRIYIVFGLYLLTHMVMTRTSFGRYVYAVGGNREAARLSGVPVYVVLIVVYALCGVGAGLSGIIDASRFGGRPSGGELYELQAIAAVVVGGTSISGGEGRVAGTLIGALIIAVIESGLSQLNIMDAYQRRVVFGALILVTVVIDQLKNRYMARSA